MISATSRSSPITTGSSWRSTMARRQVVVVATGNVAVSRELTPIVQEHLPDIAREPALAGPDDHEEFSALGILPVDVSRSASIEKFVDTVFAALERERRLPVPGLANDDIARAA
jgi:hypothetical protein